MALRLVFMGTPDFAVPTLRAIVGAGHEVAAVFTRAPAPAGRRGLSLQPSPVHTAADALGLLVSTPRSLRAEGEVDALASLRPDAVVVVAYGLILPQAVLDIPPLGCLNLHGSLLPRWRGAAPMQRALMAGDRETGVMVMRMEAGLDTGPVGMAERLALPAEMTAGELHDALAPLGAALMVRALDVLAGSSLNFVPQPDVGVTYAQKITKEDCAIDWRRPASVIHDQIRGLSPAPGAFFSADLGRGPERIKVLRSRMSVGSGEPGIVLASAGRLIVACGDAAVELLRLQRPGKPAADVAAFLNGTPVRLGLRLPSSDS